MSVSIPVLAALMVILFSSAFPVGPVQLVTEYPLPGSPYHVAVEGAGHVWGTLSAQMSVEFSLPGSGAELENS